MSWFLEKAVFTILDKLLGKSGFLVALHREQVWSEKGMRYYFSTSVDFILVPSVALFWR